MRRTTCDVALIGVRGIPRWPDAIETRPCVASTVSTQATDSLCALQLRYSILSVYALSKLHIDSRTASIVPANNARVHRA